MTIRRSASASCGAHTPLNFLSSSRLPVAARSNTPACTGWRHLNSQQIVIALERALCCSSLSLSLSTLCGCLILLIQLFLRAPSLSSRSPFLPVSRGRGEGRETPPSCRPPIPLRTSSCFHSLHFLTGLSSRLSLTRPIDLETSTIPRHRLRSDTSLCGATELLNPRFLVRLAARYPPSLFGSSFY